MEPFGDDCKANNNKGAQETNHNYNNSFNIDQANRVQGSTAPMMDATTGLLLLNQTSNSLAATSDTSRDPSSMASTAATAAPNNNIHDVNILARISAKMQQETAAADEGPPPSVNVSISDAYNLASLSSTARQTNLFTNGDDTTQTNTSLTTGTAPMQNDISTAPDGGTGNNNSIKPAPPMKKRWVEAGTFGNTDQHQKSVEKEGLSLGEESGNKMPGREREMNVAGDSPSKETQALSSVDGGSNVARSAKNNQDTVREKEKEGADTNEGKSGDDSPVNLPFTGVESQVAQTKSSVDWGQLGMTMQQAADDEPDNNDDRANEEGEEKVAAAVSTSESGATHTAASIKCSTSKPPDNKDECETEPAAPQITTFTVPPPTELPSTGVVTLRGKLIVSGGTHKIIGVWALGQDRLAEGLEFEYEHQPNGEVNHFPASGKYPGWFEIYSDDGKSKVRSPETDVELMFIRNTDDYYNIEGRGSNIYGSYYIYGTFTKEGVITMCRKFAEPEPKPRPKRTKKIASRRSSSSRKRGRPKSEGSTPKSDSPTKKKRKEKPHPDAGKRYGLGQPGLLCDCCFFDEETDVVGTPFIKCLYCGLVAHSACYPTNSTVDKNGMFLCDICTVYFHPSVNRAERTKNSTSGNIEPPKEPLAEDVAAKSDGRLHEDRAFCQLCARNDVQGGMKPTDSGAWVHLACVMSTENAYFDGKVVVGIQGELKRNRTEVIKHKKETGSKPNCEECGRKSGMLLKCKHEGCKLYMHALCAEILDRCRVVTNDGTRDIVGYKCEKHSYVGLDACGVCKLGSRQSEMIECDKCSQGYHMDCLTPPLTEIPEGDWFCATCLDAFPVDLETKNPTENDEDDEPPEGYSAMDF